LVEPKTFVCAETHVAVTQALKDSITVGQGRIEVVTEPNAVVEVDDNCDPQKAGHGGVHEALEDGRGVVPTKWKDREAVETVLRDEAEEVAGVWVDTKLPKALVQVAGAHVLGARQLVEDVGDIWQRVAVSRDAAVGDAEVVAIPHGAIRFWDLGHRRCPRTRTRFDDTELQHALYTFSL